MRAPGAAFVLAAATVWATIGLAGRAAFRAGVTPLEAAFYRAGLSFVVVLTVTLLTSPAALRVRARDLWLFAAYGLISIAIFF
ncbi:MAG: EamA/RhaT family transporter, partial [bacterium]